MSNRGEDVLERKVIHAGKPFIKAGEEHARAYMIQIGEIIAFVMDGDTKVEVMRYGPGRIIGETCLMVDEPMTMNYEAVIDTTVVTITRQDFQKKISRLDKNVATILGHVMNKLNYQDTSAIDKAREKSKIDPDAYKMVALLLNDVPQHKKYNYEKAILPHVNSLIKEIKLIKGADKAGEASNPDAAG